MQGVALIKALSLAVILVKRHNLIDRSLPWLVGRRAQRPLERAYEAFSVL